MLTIENLTARIKDVSQRYIDSRIDSDLKFDYLKIDAFKSLQDWKIDNELFNLEKYLVSFPRKMPSLFSNQFKNIKIVLINNKLLCYCQKSSGGSFTQNAIQAYINYTYFKSELKFKQMLDALKIYYIKEYPICVNSIMHVDFYLPDYNYCIEINESHDIDIIRCNQLVKLGYKVFNISGIMQGWVCTDLKELNNFVYKKVDTLDSLSQRERKSFVGKNQKLVELLIAKKVKHELIQRDEITRVCQIQRWTKARARLLNLYQKFNTLGLDLFSKFKTYEEFEQALSSDKHNRYASPLNLLL